ncbi:MAG: hypothetical protein PVF45_08530 [Anaerolineae bacterium]
MTHVEGKTGDGAGQAGPAISGRACRVWSRQATVWKTPGSRERLKEHNTTM